VKDLLEVEIRRSVPAAPAAPLVEEYEGPPLPEEVRELVECAISSGYDGYREQSFEDKLRQAVGMIRNAVTEEAWRNMGDDGRALKKLSDGDTPWAAVDRVLIKAVYPDQFKGLVAKAREAIAKYYE
jgi:hypothetical protein